MDARCAAKQPVVDACAMELRKEKVGPCQNVYRLRRAVKNGGFFSFSSDRLKCEKHRIFQKAKQSLQRGLRTFLASDLYTKESERQAFSSQSSFINF